jgi:hypothetical protein
MINLKEISGLNVCLVLPIRGTISQATVGSLQCHYYPDKPNVYTQGSMANSTKFEENDVASIEESPSGFGDVKYVIRLKGA